MRRLILLGAVLSFAGVVLLAQTHQNTAEKTVKQRITLDADTRVGGELLKAGEYRVTCDRETIEFRGPGNKSFKFPCKGPELAGPSPRNEVHTSPGEGNTKVLTKLLLKGSNVEHTFN